MTYLCVYTCYISPTLLLVVMEYLSLRETCVGKDRDISFKNSEAAILMLPSWRAGDHEDITAELIQMGGAGLHTALWENEHSLGARDCPSILRIWRCNDSSISTSVHIGDIVSK
jgi:hypothetical protein